jgi:2-polyprenyl-3-methyl-5-hydroxy-6-metoxy-1,4-benzoquinol methylase
MSFARQKGLSVQFGNIESIGADERDFGLIIVCHVLEHIVDPKKFLSTTAQHLSEGGLLFVEVPMIDGVLTGDYRGLLGRYFQNAHVTHFSTKSLISMLEQVGLQVLKTDSFGRVLAVKNNIEQVISPVSLLGHQKSLLADLLSVQSNYFRKQPLKSVIYFLYDLVKPLFKR